MKDDATNLAALKSAWSAKWPEALALWSKFTKLGEPRWCMNSEEEIAETLGGSFAMIRLDDQGIVISLRQIFDLGLQAFPLEIMAHEIGHHILCPADLSDQGRMLARMRRSLPTKEHLAGFIANLYADLLINDRLQRQSELRMAEVYRTLGKGSQDRMWTFYMRIYEILWALPKGTLAGGPMNSALEGDAVLGARLVRSYAKDWLQGAGRFAALCFTYLLPEDGKTLQELLKGIWDIKNLGDQGFPDGLTTVDAGEIEGAVHPAMDDAREEGFEPLQTETKAPKARREIVEYGEILKSLGVKLNDQEVAQKYYRELALPYLVKFPHSPPSKSVEPFLEGLDSWDAGEAIDQLDWFESQLRGPSVIPGYTTVQRSYGESDGDSPARRPLNLFLGIDCSGSMPDPQQQLSYPVLAGTIMALSALRAGAKVKVVLSGEPGRHHSTDGFISDESEILKVLTSYLGSGTFFSIHRLGETFLVAGEELAATHILVISDIDLFNSLDQADARGNGWAIAKKSAVAAQGGASYVLHMPESFQAQGVARMRAEGWSVHTVVSLENLLQFARDFSRSHYEKLGKAP